MKRHLNLSVSLAFDRDENDWNNFVCQHPKAVPQGFYQWRRVLERSYNLQTNFLICRSKQMVCGVLPAYSVGGKISPKRMYVVRSGFWATTRQLIVSYTKFCRSKQKAKVLKRLR